MYIYVYKENSKFKKFIEIDIQNVIFIYNKHL